ncbi:hypothetical protein LCGC14_1238970 [marine sediment metagenome]|uniref:Uncharacterized protein n=1 Tax=marine sediment metagenome TaxID=412755 RepID=A0A0F9P3P1_9ZZZZ
MGKIKQLFCIYSLKQYFRSAYKLKAHIGIRKYNLNIIDTIPKIKFKKRWLKRNELSRKI